MGRLTNTPPTPTKPKPDLATAALLLAAGCDPAFLDAAVEHLVAHDVADTYAEVYEQVRGAIQWAYLHERGRG